MVDPHRGGALGPAAPELPRPHLVAGRVVLADEGVPPAGRGLPREGAEGLADDVDVPGVVEGDALGQVPLGAAELAGPDLVARRVDAPEEAVDHPDRLLAGELARRLADHVEVAGRIDGHAVGVVGVTGAELGRPGDAGGGRVGGPEQSGVEGGDQRHDSEAAGGGNRRSAHTDSSPPDGSWASPDLSWCPPEATEAVAVGRQNVRTGQPWVRASRRRRRSGLTATGRPAAVRSGRSDIESEYAVAKERSGVPSSNQRRASLPRP